MEAPRKVPLFKYHLYGDREVRKDLIEKSRVEESVCPTIAFATSRDCCCQYYHHDFRVMLCPGDVTEYHWRHYRVLLATLQSIIEKVLMELLCNIFVIYLGDIIVFSRRVYRKVHNDKPQPIPDIWNAKERSRDGFSNVWKNLTWNYMLKKGSFFTGLIPETMCITEWH